MAERVALDAYTSLVMKGVLASEEEAPCGMVAKSQEAVVGVERKRKVFGEAHA